MTENTQLTTTTEGPMSKLEALQFQAKAMIASGLMPKGITTVSQVITLALMGQALNIPAIVAVNMINIISGKPTISPQLMLAIVNRSGLLADMKIETTDTQATMTVWRKGQPTPHTETFSMDDARKLGLAGKDNWNKQPRTMLKWRVVAACLRVAFPDLLLGFYTPEEMGAKVTIGDDDSMTIDATELEKTGASMANKATTSPATSTQDKEPGATLATYQATGLVNTDAARKAFFEACKARGLDSMAVGKVIKAAGKLLSDLTVDQAMAIVFPDTTEGSHASQIDKSEIPF